MYMIVPKEKPLLNLSKERIESMSESNKLELVRMSEIELQDVKWLWEPYIPFGKITIIQGNPGEGKTTLALRLAAACSTGTSFASCEMGEPFNVIYQTA